MRSREVEIVKMLIENKDKELNINQAAKLLKKDYKNTHNIISRLEKISLVSLQPFGRSYRVILQNKVHPLIFEAEYQRRNELMKNKDIKLLIDDLNKLPLQFIVLLFGSYAKGTELKHSDIDLLIITENEDKINDILRLYHFKIHPTFITLEQFIQMLKSKDFTVVSEAVKKNYILAGIEDYYRMMEYAG